MKFTRKNRILNGPLVKPVVDVLNNVLGFDDKSIYVEHLFRTSLLHTQ